MMKLSIRSFFMLFVLVVILLIAACSPSGEKPHVVTTAANAVTFQVALNGNSGTNQNQLNGVDFWTKNLKPLTHNIVVHQYQIDGDSSKTWYDTDAVISVDTTAVSKTWNVTSITQANPNPDESQAFQVQVESTGVDTGAQLSLHIDPVDAALYLATYNYVNTPDGNGAYPQYPIASVIDNEIRPFIQTALTTEYAKYTLAQIESNQYDAVIFSAVKQELTDTYKKKGLTIDNFGQQGGDVYENLSIQTQIDAALQAKNRIAQAQLDAQEAQVHALATMAAQQAAATVELQQAAVGATATAIAVNSSISQQERQAQLLQQYPQLLQYLQIEKWNGNPSMIAQGGNTSVIIPAPDMSMLTPTATPTPKQ